MRRILLAVGICLLSLATGLRAGPADPAETIRLQTEALGRDDFLTAFSYASPTIRQLFGNSENFGLMVRRGYPMLHRPAALKMLGQSAFDGGLLQEVEITDDAGRRHYLEYEMILMPDGWRINGVRFIPAPDPGV